LLSEVNRKKEQLGQDISVWKKVCFNFNVFLKTVFLGKRKRERERERDREIDRQRGREIER
jgi:hypothetical protein